MSLRSVAEGMRSGNNQVQEGGQESENPSETGADAGAVDDLSSGGEENNGQPPGINMKIPQLAHSRSVRIKSEATYR